MMKFLKTDLKRSFSEPAFFLGAILGIISLFAPAVYFMLTDTSADGIYSRAQSLVLPFAAPLLAAMPYSTMIMLEKETHYRMMMNAKFQGKSYEFIRLLVCGISGGAVLFIPQLLLFAFCAVSGQIDDIPLRAQELVLPMCFGAGYAVFSYGLTFVNRQRYIPTAIPQVIYLFCVYAFPHLKLERFYPPLDISPAIYGGEISLDRFVIPAVLTLAGLILTMTGVLSGRSRSEQ